MNRFLPYLAMLGASSLWASSGAGNKWVLLHGIEVPEVILFRVLGGAIVLWSIVLILQKDFRKAGKIPILMGVLEPGMVTFFIVSGIALTSAVNAAVVWGIMPLTQPLLARIFLHEPIRRSVLLGACFALSGVALLFLTKNQDGTGDLFGDFLLVCAVLSASVNQLLARHVATSRREPIVTTAFQMATGAVLACVFFLFTTPVETAYDAAGLPELLVLIFLISTTAGPFFLYNFALQYLEVGRISLFAPVSGPLGVVIATIVFREPLSAMIILAIVLALSGVFMPILADRLAARSIKTDQ